MENKTLRRAWLAFVFFTAALSFPVIVEEGTEAWLRWGHTVVILYQLFGWWAWLIPLSLSVSWWLYFYPPTRMVQSSKIDVETDFNPTMRRTEVRALLLLSPISKRIEKKEGAERANDYITHWLYEEIVSYDSNTRRAMKGVYTSSDVVSWLKEQEIALVRKTVVFWLCAVAVGAVCMFFLRRLFGF